MNIINITFIRRTHEVKHYLRQKKPEIKIKGRLYSTASPETYYTRRFFMLMEDVFIYEGDYIPLKIKREAIEADTDATTTINMRAFALAKLQAQKREKTESGILYGLIAALILETILLFIMGA